MSVDHVNLDERHYLVTLMKQSSSSTIEYSNAILNDYGLVDCINNSTRNGVIITIMEINQDLYELLVAKTKEVL